MYHSSGQQPNPTIGLRASLAHSTEITQTIIHPLAAAQNTQPRGESDRAFVSAMRQTIGAALSQVDLNIVTGS